MSEQAEGRYLGGIRDLRGLQDRCYVDPDTGCWRWRMCFAQGAACAHVVSPVDGKRHTLRGPRAAWILKHKSNPPKGYTVWAACWQRDCCNPNHMRCTTQVERGRAIAEAGKLKGLPGRVAINTRICREKLAKLDPEKVREIRGSSGTLKEIARRYGISVGHASKIRRGKAWQEAANAASVFSWRGAA